MSDEKLTVAELLARRNMERGDSAGSGDRPRRRRRSLEEGGVTVAELTGSIPRVEAEGPRRGAHAVADDDDQVTETAETAEATEAAVAADAAGDDEFDGSAEAEYADELVASEEAEDEGVEEEPVAAPPVVVEDDHSDFDGAAEFEEEGSAEAEYADELAAAEQLEDSPAEADEQSAEAEHAEQTESLEHAESREPFSVPSAVPVDPRPVMANDETGEITFTFMKFHDARTASEPVAEVGPMALEVLEGSMAYDDRPTRIIPVIEGEEFDEATGAETGAGAAGVEESTAADDAYADDAYADEASSDEAYADDARTGGPFDGASPAIAAAASAAAPAVAASKATKKSRGDYSEDNSLSIGLLIAQTIVGLLLGGLVFALFMVLWVVLPVPVVAVIAVAFALGLVVIVNLLRRERDRLTPILAGIVGLVVSFAPYVLTMM